MQLSYICELGGILGTLTLLVSYPDLCERSPPFASVYSSALAFRSILELDQGIHGVKLSAYARLTSVLVAVFPLTTLFLPLLDRLCLSFVNNTAGGTRSVSPVVRIIEAREFSPGSVSVYSSY